MPLSLAFAVPDHPWVDGNDGAAVRIAMTVGVQGTQPGSLNRIVSEMKSESETRKVDIASVTGKIFSDLTIGADVASALPLTANLGLTFPGIEPHGKAFVVSPDEARELGLGKRSGLESHIRPYLNGRDLTGKPRNALVIDLFGLEIDDVKLRFPEVYQWVKERIKPERDHNPRPSRRDKWWIFGEPCPKFRAALPPLSRYIATVKTAKHRTFQYVSSDTLPDSKLIACTLDQPEILGVLSSRVHTCWATAAGSALGVGNDPTYVKTKSFEAFSFPALDEAAVAQIGKLATRVDAHRKDQLTEHPSLTLTGMYNVLEKLRASEKLTDKEKTIHQQGLVSVLQELHDELDHAVFRAYGWSDLAEKLVGRPGATAPLPDKPAGQAEAEEELLMRLVELNKQRAEEESRGIVRWLRPEYQAPDAVQTEVDIAPKAAAAKTEAVTSKGKATFPKAIPDQLRVLREALAERSYTTESLAELFKRKPVKTVEEGLQSLVAVGVAEYETSTGTWHTV